MTSTTRSSWKRLRRGSSFLVTASVVAASAAVAIPASPAHAATTDLVVDSLAHAAPDGEFGVDWTWDTLPAGDEYEVTVTGTAPDPAAGDLVNTARVTGNEPDPNPDNNEDTTTADPAIGVCVPGSVYANSGDYPYQLVEYSPDGTLLSKVELVRAYTDIAFRVEGGSLSLYGIHPRAQDDTMTHWLYRIDPITGDELVTTQVSGLPTGRNDYYANALSALPDGTLLTGSTPRLRSAEIYQIDPETGVATLFPASFPDGWASSGDFLTLADGDLLAVGDATDPNDATNALFRIDLDSYAVTMVGTVPRSYGAAQVGGKVYLAGVDGGLYEIADVPTAESADPVPYTTVVETGLAFYGATATQDSGVCEPIIATSLVDEADGDRVLPIGGGTVVDTVTYANLTPGIEYTVTGELMDKSDGSGTGITGEATFTPTRPSGTVEVEFTVPGGYTGVQLVAFERVFDDPGGDPVAVHEDIDDVAQTVTVGEPTPLPELGVAKSSDPESGSTVTAGQEVTYTLTFTNSGDGPGTVDYTDDLAAVLDDADLTRGPVSSDAALLATDGADGLIRVTGTLAPDQTVTVTYTVTVKPDGDRGDNQLRNVVVETGEEPPAECEPGRCTEHPIGELDAWKTVNPATGSTLRPGETATYTLHFANTGTAPVPVNRDDVLTGVLDDADVTRQPVPSSEALTVSEITDGRFTITGELAPGEEATVSYEVMVKPDGQRGDDRLGNFLVPSGENPPEGPCVPADPERPDCTVNHVSDVAVAKSSDPESGTEVDPGQVVTYTVTFTNRSANPDADAAAVDYTDHMADVLDDATLTAGPTVSNENLTATVEGESIRITGSVPTAAVYTVTYTVTVNDYAEQGNHVLGNVVAVTGEEPVCVDGSPLCTEHDVPEPPATPVPSEEPGGWLPNTGAEISAAVLLAALLLLGVGGGMVLHGRRRKPAAQGASQEASIDDLF